MQIDIEIVPCGKRKHALQQCIEIDEWRAMVGDGPAGNAAQQAIQPDTISATRSPNSSVIRSIGHSATAWRSIRPRHSCRISRTTPHFVRPYPDRFRYGCGSPTRRGRRRNASRIPCGGANPLPSSSAGGSGCEPGIEKRAVGIGASRDGVALVQMLMDIDQCRPDLAAAEIDILDTVISLTTMWLDPRNLAVIDQQISFDHAFGVDRRRCGLDQEACRYASIR